MWSRLNISPQLVELIGSGLDDRAGAHPDLTVFVLGWVKVAPVLEDGGTVGRRQFVCHENYLFKSYVLFPCDADQVSVCLYSVQNSGSIVHGAKRLRANAFRLDAGACHLRRHFAPEPESAS